MQLYNNKNPDIPYGLGWLLSTKNALSRHSRTYYQHIPQELNVFKSQPIPIIDDACKPQHI